jgi:hypothetical protein
MIFQTTFSLNLIHELPIRPARLQDHFFGCGIFLGPMREETGHEVG